MIETKKRLTPEQLAGVVDAVRAAEQRGSTLTDADRTILDLADANRYAQVSLVANVAKVFGVECDTTHGDLRKHIMEVSRAIQNKYWNTGLYINRLEAALHNANSELADLAAPALPGHVVACVDACIQYAQDFEDGKDSDAHLDCIIAGRAARAKGGA